MPSENFQIVAGVVTGVIVLLIAATFIFILVTYSNRRKNRYIQEQQHLQLKFKEQLLQAQLEIQEQTFRDISEEIHDNVGQILSLAKVQLNIIEQAHPADWPMMTNVKDSISMAMTELRDLAKSLHSDRVRHRRLIETTSHELSRLNRLGVMEANLSVLGHEKDMNEQKKLILLRIVQESLQNILKHAKAKKIKVVFNYGENDLKIEIMDDGVGFDTATVGQLDGLGLQNILNRAAAIGGEALIKSNLNEGTFITIISPYA